MVDKKFPNREKFSVVSDQGRELNSNLINVLDNHEKYYVVQVVQDDKKEGNFICFRRWGRCGSDGMSGTKGYPHLSEALEEYDQILESKLEHGYTEVIVSYT